MINSLSRLNDKTVIIVPCYNAEKTIVETLNAILDTGFTNIIVSDDNSYDNTYKQVKNHFPEIDIVYQETNLGYGGNQKFLYNYVIKNNFDYVIMIHGDLQYTPKLVPPMVSMMHFANYDFVFGSRILGGNAIKGGMPIIKYIANRVLTLIQNLSTGYKLSEYHSGLRGYKLDVLQYVDYKAFSNNFFFDNQMIIEIIRKEKIIGEVSCTTNYDTNSSSISYLESFKYALQVLLLTGKYLFRRIIK